MNINKYEVYKEKKHIYAGSERYWESKSGVREGQGFYRKCKDQMTRIMEQFFVFKFQWDAG